MNYELIKARQGHKVKYYIHHLESGGIWSARTSYYGKTFPLIDRWEREAISPENAPKWVKNVWSDFIR